MVGELGTTPVDRLVVFSSRSRSPDRRWIPYHDEGGERARQRVEEDLSVNEQDSYELAR